MHPVHNVKECERVMNQGWSNRATGATLMNADSSRSHSIFSIHMEMITNDEEGKEHIRVGKLNLVDLAGSERQAKTGMPFSLKIEDVTLAEVEYKIYNNTQIYIQFSRPVQYCISYYIYTKPVINCRIMTFICPSIWHLLFAGIQTFSTHCVCMCTYQMLCPFYASSN